MTMALVASGLGATRPADAQSIDPCLVGAWEAMTVTVLRAAGTGGDGFRVTFLTDGTQVIDYSPSKLWVTRDGSVTTLMWGTAKGRISTQSRVARIEGSVETDVSRRITWANVDSDVRPVPGLGPGGLGNTLSDNGYACSDQSLEYQSSVADDRSPTHALKLTRLKDAPPPEGSPVAVNGKTWLTVTEIKDRPQDLRGVWLDDGAAVDDPLSWLDPSPPGSLVNHPADTRAGGPMYLDMRKQADDEHWSGLVYICPRPKGKCPNLCVWARGSMAVDGNHLSARINWQDKKSKSDCSGFEDQPDSGTVNLKRLLGPSFMPIAKGKYMHLVGAPAVGNQAAQFTAVARIATNYDKMPGVTVRAGADRGKVHALDQKAGTYDFVADASGVFEVTFDLIGGDGQAFHTDRLRVEIPAIPGLGK
jgi:hypothetical protein